MPGKRIFIHVLIAFIAGTLLLTYIQYSSSKNINKLISGNQSLLEEIKNNDRLRELEKNVITVEDKIRGRVSTGDSSFIEGLERNIIDIETDLGHLQKISDNDSSVLYVDRLDVLVHKRLLVGQQMLDTFRVSGRSSAEKMIADVYGKELTDSIVTLVQLINSTRKKHLAELTVAIDKSGKKAQQLNNVLILLALTSAALLFWYIIAIIRRQQSLISQLDRSEKMVQASAKIKENFLANMSHEIRTPMNAVLGFTNLLQRQDLDSKSKEYVQAIQRSGENLLTIINDILDISKIEAGMMRIESAPFSVRGLVQSVEVMFADKAKEKGLSFSAIVDNTLPDILEGDAIRLTQILINLVGNSLKFTNKGTISIHITNEGVTGNTINAGIIVADTGIGIEQEKLDYIFERFKQADDTITRKFGGSGLGLSIVNDLVFLQKGSIKVESEPGKGTTFKLVIPYKISSEYTRGSVSTLHTPEAIKEFKQFRILVAEDNEINQNLIGHLFNEWQLEYDLVSTGKKAVEALKTGRYDIVLMDIQMPEMDGYSATQEIRSVLKLDIPIIAMTAHALSGEREKCLSYGMNAYISKPIREDQLYQLISEFAHLKSTTSKKEPDAGLNKNKRYRYIDLQYMKEVSRGNFEYERTVTGLFIEAIPNDLQSIENSWNKKDIHEMRRTVHNMRSTISIMGLNEILQHSLDALEFENLSEENFLREFQTLKSICEGAVDEAKQYIAFTD
ncbi:MAG: response regulator [Chitinophagaceae bacterium]|nr:response regulator [Chitinophagaceae bacterium]